MSTREITMLMIDECSPMTNEMWEKLTSNLSPREVEIWVSERRNKMNFGQAIEAMKSGHKVRRKGWNGKGIFIEIQNPDAHSKMTHPYIFIDTTGLQTDNPDAPKDRVPWLASQTDMLSEDWEHVSPLDDPKRDAFHQFG